MKLKTAVLCVALAYAPLSQADVVTDWNRTAIDVMKELPDLSIAYGVSDEYRYVC